MLLRFSRYLGYRVWITRGFEGIVHCTESLEESLTSTADWIDRADILYYIRLNTKFACTAPCILCRAKLFKPCSDE